MTKRSVTKKPKLTQWFDGSVKPVRDGLYERKRANGEILTWFFVDGYWRVGAFKPDEEPEVFFMESTEENLPWRGLAQNPEVQP